jgi:hypothetical protein
MSTVFLSDVGAGAACDTFMAAFLLSSNLKGKQTVYDTSNTLAFSAAFRQPTTGNPL